MTTRFDLEHEYRELWRAVCRKLVKSGSDLADGIQDDQPPALDELATTPLQKHEAPQVGAELEKFFERLQLMLEELVTDFEGGITPGPKPGTSIFFPRSKRAGINQETARALHHTLTQDESDPDTIKNRMDAILNPLPLLYLYLMAERDTTKRLLLIGPETIAALLLLWHCMPAETTDRLMHPVAVLIEGWLMQQKAIQEHPKNAKILTTKGMARVPNHAKTAALAQWEKLTDAVVVEVDGEPISSPYHYRPRHASRSRNTNEILKLPGTKAAMDLRLARLRDIEEHAHIDRRSPLPGDTLYLFSLGGALTVPITLHVDDLGAMLAGIFLAAGATPKQKANWRARAWSAITWASMDIKMPSGHWMPLLRIDRGGDLPEGVVRIWPYSWPKGTASGYRLTGTLTGQIPRSDRSGSFARLIAGIEDYIAASTPTHRIPRLLKPERPGGAGPVSEFIPYPVLLARSGFYFDLTDKRSYDATRQLWQRLKGQIESKGYLLPSPRAEAEAGDTVEIVSIKKGKPTNGGMGGLIVRASARYIEAHEVIRRKRGKALDAVPLHSLFLHNNL